MEPEFITGGKWDIINGVKNFASLTPDEALLNAKTKMYGLVHKSMTCDASL